MATEQESAQTTARQELDQKQEAFFLAGDALRQAILSLAKANKSLREANKDFETAAEIYLATSDDYSKAKTTYWEVVNLQKVIK